jgi:CheY-like chemotaxis protein
MYTNCLKIVVADNDEEMRSYYSRILPSMGHAAVAVTANGPDLVRRAEEYEADLVITDLHLPQMTSLGIANGIRESIPYIVVSTVDRPEDCAHEQFRSLVDYLVKPVAKEQIKAAIDKAVELLSSRETLGVAN